MSLDNFWGLLKTDTWYKLLAYGALVVLLLSLFTDVKGVAPGHLQLVSLGIFLAALGEWPNHTTQSAIIPPNAYNGGQALKVTRVIRRPTVIGVILNVVGTITAIVGFAYMLGLPRLIGTP